MKAIEHCRARSRSRKEARSAERSSEGSDISMDESDLQFPDDSSTNL